jgi:hypothetical protein
MSGKKIVVNDEEHNLSFDLLLDEVCLYVARTSDLMERTESWWMHLHDQGLVLGLAFLGKLEILKFNFKFDIFTGTKLIVNCISVIVLTFNMF